MSLLLLLSDEDFCGSILSGLRRRFPDLDIIRAMDVGLDATPDDEVLAWCADHGRVLVSHDVNTMIKAAQLRTSSNQPMAGLIVVPQSLPYATAIEQVHYVAEVCTHEEMTGSIIYLPV